MNNDPSKHICSVDEIYIDSPIRRQLASNQNSMNQINRPHFSGHLTITNGSNPNRVSIKYQNPQRVQRDTENWPSSCGICKNKLIQGESIYHCNCHVIYHPACLFNVFPNFSTTNCPKCHGVFQVGVYCLKVFPNYLNTGVFNNYNNKNDSVCNGAQENISNYSFANTTMDQSIISKDTNLNNLEDYDNVCKTVENFDKEENVIEFIKGAKTMSNTSPIHPKINTSFNLISLQRKSNQSQMISRLSNYPCTSNAGNSSISPIPNTGSSPFIGNQTFEKIDFNFNNYNMRNPNPNAIKECSTNLMKQFSFRSTSDSLNPNQFSSNVNYQNVSLTSLIESQLTQPQNEANFHNLSVPDFDDEEVGLDNFDDQENMPPIPKVLSKFQNRCINENEEKAISNKNGKPNFEIDTTNDILNVDVEAGFSHINSDYQKLVEIPINVEISINERAKRVGHFSYAKDFLIVFNTDNLNLDTKCLILKNIYRKMGEYDRICSNTIIGHNWLRKDDLCGIVAQPKKIREFLEETSSSLSYIDLCGIVKNGINCACNSTNNSFNILFFAERGNIQQNQNYLNELNEIGQMIKNKNVNFLKEFTINAIVLDDKSQPKTQENLKYYSFLYDLSTSCLGYYFACFDFNGLITSVNRYFTAQSQIAVLNSKLILNFNKDPSIVFSGLTYPCMKIAHNSYEVYLGSIRLNEKKNYNFNLKVILNKTNFYLLLPLVEVGVEYSISKSTLVEIERHNKEINQTQFVPQELFDNFSDFLNLVRNRTLFYSLNQVILNEFKPVTICNKVYLKYIFATISKEISEVVSLIQNFNLENAAAKINQIKEELESSLLNKTTVYQKLLLKAQQNLPFPNTNFNQNNQMGGVSNFNSFSQNNQKGNEKLEKVISYLKIIIKDINFLSNMINNKNLNDLSNCFVQCESLLYNRNVVLTDERFLDN